MCRRDGYRNAVNHRHGAQEGPCHECVVDIRHVYKVARPFTENVHRIPVYYIVRDEVGFTNGFVFKQQLSEGCDEFLEAHKIRQIFNDLRDVLNKN